jgi:hypothetical protein
MMKRRANGEETLAEIAGSYNVNFMVQPLHSLDGISLTRSFVPGEDLGTVVYARAPYLRGMRPPQVYPYLCRKVSIKTRWLSQIESHAPIDPL